MMNWKDPENQKRLAELWAEGLTCSQIARMFGGDVTRNAVIGAVTRAKLPVRGHRYNGGGSPKKPPAAVRRRRKPLPPQLQQSKSAEIFFDRSPLPPPAETDIPRVSTDDVLDHQCRWPCWGDVVPPKGQPAFCGEKKVPGLPYCEPHAKRAFNPPPPRRYGNVIPMRQKVAA